MKVDQLRAEVQPGPVRLSRVFAAPRETVFKAWSSADHIKRWFCPAGYSVPEAKVEMRVGGAFEVCMRSPEGVDHWTKGTHMGVFGSSGQVHRHIKKLRWLFRYPRSEPYFMTWLVPHQIKLTSGRRSKQLHQYPAFGGWGSGGRDHSFTRLFKPVHCSVRSPGSVRAG